MKKIMAILLTVAMLFSVAAISASAAETDVAAIGEATYATLADAITAATADDTITLLDDVTENVTISENLTLDGAGKQYTGTISVSGGKAFVAKNVKFVDGFISANTKNIGNSITVKSCSFTGEGTYKIIMNSGKNLIVEDCDAKDIGQGLAYAKNSVSNIYFKNVNVDGAVYGLNMVNNNTTKFENVVMKNVQRGLQFQTNSPKTITFQDCVIEAENAPVYVSRKAETIQTVIYKGNNDFGTDDYTFGCDLVKTVFDVAKIGDVTYTSIKEAVAAANDGDVITVIKDHAIADSEAYFGTAYPSYYVFLEVNEKKVTIDLNGKVVTLNPDLDKMLLAIFLANANGEITLKDSSEAKTGAINVTASDASSVYSMFMADNGGKFNIESGNYYLNKVDISDKAPRAMLYAGSDKLFTVNGGNFILANAHTETTVFGKGEAAYDVAHPWIANVYGDGKGAIAINAGSFNVDPSHHHGEASYPVCYTPVETDGKWVITLVHTPGAAATCQAPQTCTVCGTELDAIKVHTYETYVSNNDATCTADGTKTAECIYGCGEKDTVADEGSMKPHTPGDAATCKAAQTCTVCGTELDAIKDHEFGEYVSDGNATCKENGTKTAECIYGCGLKDTVTDKGSATGHKDADGNGNCDDCNAEFCDTCGKVHDNWMSMLFCLIVDFIKLVISFFSSVC